MATTLGRGDDLRDRSSAEVLGQLSLFLVLALLGGATLGLMEVWYRQVFRLEFIFEAIAVPAALAAGWAMLALWRRGRARWFAWGLVAGGLALLPPAFVVFTPRPEVGWLTLAQVIGYEAVALLAGLAIARPWGRLTWPAVAVALACWVAVFALTALSGFGFVAVGSFTMPILIVAPFVASTHPADEELAGWPADGRLRWGYLLLPVGLIAGWAGTLGILG